MSNSSFERWLFLSPHTDDAEIAAGGLMSRVAAAGKLGSTSMYHYAFSLAQESLDPGWDEMSTAREFVKACEVYEIPLDEVAISDDDGMVPVRRFPEHRQSILDTLVFIRNQWGPHVVVGPSLNDCHQDHQVVAQEMIRAFKRHASILCYEHPRNDAGFTPQMWVTLGEGDVETKMRAIGCYASQIAKANNFLDEGSIRARLQFRGQQVNTQYAEAYEVVRWMLR